MDLGNKKKKKITIDIDYNEKFTYSDIKKIMDALEPIKDEYEIVVSGVITQ